MKAMIVFIHVLSSVPEGKSSNYRCEPPSGFYRLYPETNYSRVMLLKLAIQLF